MQIIHICMFSRFNAAVLQLRVIVVCLVSDRVSAVLSAFQQIILILNQPM